VHRDLLKSLCCPLCHQDLTLRNEREDYGKIKEGTLSCESCGATFPIQDYIPRFVPAGNYADTFGLQWNLFRHTQLDSHTGKPISRERFFNSTGWSPEELNGAVVLDVGCGAGRFAEVALDCGARVVAVDYSSAVDACRDNHEKSEHLDVVQGDIYRLPFKAGVFDFVYCLGVLQHTPDVKRSFMSLVPLVRPAGKLAADVYPKLLRNLLWPKYWLRPVTKRIPKRALLRIVKVMVALLLPVSRLIGRLPQVGRKLRYAVPVVNYEGVFPLDDRQLREWSVLDTYDMLSPAYDSPQTAPTLRQWFGEAGMEKVEVFRKGFIIGRAVKGGAPNSAG
jgi:SAM-dependent methyltransferase